MKDKGIVKRFFIPLAALIGLWAVSCAVYEGAAGSLPPGGLRTALVALFAPLLFLSVWGAGFIGPIFGYLRGATFPERALLAFANPLIWITRVEARVACQFSAVELVYFLFLPWIFGLVCVTCFELGLSELACRFVHRRRAPGSARISHPVVWLLIVGGLAGTYLGLIRGQEWVYGVVHHYAVHALP